MFCSIEKSEKFKKQKKLIFTPIVLNSKVNILDLIL